jgi:hypothetical protein
MESQVAPLLEPADAELEPASVARAARSRLAQWWPALSESVELPD